MFQQYLKEKKKQIEKNLHAFINRQNKSLDKSCVWGRDVLNRLDEFIPRGKSVRGALVYLGRDVTNNEYTPAVDNAALAMEFFRAGFLIHDDIMDHDELRRGHPSIHRQYQMVLNHNHIKNSKIGRASCRERV